MSAYAVPKKGRKGQKMTKKVVSSPSNKAARKRQEQMASRLEKQKAKGESHLARQRLKRAI